MASASNTTSAAKPAINLGDVKNAGLKSLGLGVGVAVVAFTLQGLVLGGRGLVEDAKSFAAGLKG